MTTLKGWITTTALVTTLMISTVSVNAGVIIAGRNTTPSDPCVDTGTGKLDAKDEFGGVIIAGVGGVIIAGLTGVIIAGFSGEAIENCGVIIAG